VVEEDREGAALASIINRKRPLLQNGDPGIAILGGKPAASPEVHFAQTIL